MVFAERVQALLPCLVDVQGGGGVTFMLPALLQLIRPDPDEPGGALSRQAWLVHLSDDQVHIPAALRFLPPWQIQPVRPPCTAWLYGRVSGPYEAASCRYT